MGDGKPVVLVGRVDGSVEVWDLDNAERLIEWKPAGADYARKLAVCDTTDGSVVVAGWDSSKIGVLNIITNESVVRNTEGGHITALCATAWDGQLVCVGATEDLWLMTWELPSLRLLQKRRRATRAPIYALRVAEVGNARVLLSGGDSMDEGKIVERSVLRFWSFPALAPLWGDRRGSSAPILHLELGRVAGQNLLIASKDAWAPTEVWDLDSRTMIFEEAEPRTRSWLLEIGDNPVLLSTYLGKLTINPIHFEVPNSQNKLEIRPYIDQEVEIGRDRLCGMARLHGRQVLLVAQFDRVRVWDIAELLTKSWSQGIIQTTPLPINTLTAGSESARELFAGTADGRVLALDADTGAEKWQLRVAEDEEAIMSLAFYDVGDRRVVAAAGHRGSIYVIDPDTRRLRQPPIQAGDHIGALAIAHWHGELLAFVTVRDGRSWAVRVWGLDSRTERTPNWPELRRWALSYGQQDKVLYALAVARLRDTIRFAFASKYGKVMVADFGDALSERSFEEWRFPHANEEYTYSLAVACFSKEWLLAGGNEDGHLAVWNLLSSEPRSAIRTAHLSSISTLCFHNLNGQGVLASGGKDGALKVWAINLRQLLNIDLGESILKIAWVGTNHLAIATLGGALMLKFDEGLLSSLCSEITSATHARRD